MLAKIYFQIYWLLPKYGHLKASKIKEDITDLRACDYNQQSHG
jgi:hypothetical protein